MEISDGSAVRVSPEDPFDLKVMRAFQDVVGLIRVALTSHYRLTEKEAGDLERDLEVWFRRFCRRNPTTDTVREKLPSLLVMCCTFARSYQKSKLPEGFVPPDERLARALEQKPQDVACVLISAWNC